MIRVIRGSIGSLISSAAEAPCRVRRGRFTRGPSRDDHLVAFESLGFAFFGGPIHERFL